VPAWWSRPKRRDWSGAGVYVTGCGSPSPFILYCLQLVLRTHRSRVLSAFYHVATPIARPSTVWSNVRHCSARHSMRGRPQNHERLPSSHASTLPTTLTRPYFPRSPWPRFDPSPSCCSPSQVTLRSFPSPLHGPTSPTSSHGLVECSNPTD
jgi:hypothetical protein